MSNPSNSIEAVVALMHPGDQPAAQQRLEQIMSGRNAFTPEQSGINISNTQLTVETKEDPYELTVGMYLIGKSSQNTIQLPYSGISRFHCLIEVRPDGVVTIQDLGSTNGTRINGIWVQPYEAHQLHLQEQVLIAELARLMLVEK